MVHVNLLDTIKWRWIYHPHHGGSFPDQLDDVASVEDRHPRCIQDVNTSVQHAAFKLWEDKTSTSSFISLIVLIRVFVCVCMYLSIHPVAGRHSSNRTLVDHTDVVQDVLGPLGSVREKHGVGCRERETRHHQTPLTNAVILRVAS